MKKIVTLLLLLFIVCHESRSEQPQDSAGQRILFMGAEAHIGDGTVIHNAAMGISNGKITFIMDGTGFKPAASAFDTIIAIPGKHLYPGFIAMNTTLGIREIELVRATNDYVETGDMNPGARSLIAYNTDSKVIPTVKSNGVLMAQICPEGGLLSGMSSVVTLDGWNWEDAVVKADEGMIMNWPSMQVVTNPTVSENEQRDKIAKKLMDLDSYFSQAKAYALSGDNVPFNTQFEAMKKLFNGTLKLYIHADQAKEIISAIRFCRKFELKMVLVGGNDSWRIAPVLKENEIPVVVVRTHKLPAHNDDDTDISYRLPALLYKAGVKFCITDEGYWQQRNVPFEAGTAVGYGLPYEEAVRAITLNPAEILGISNETGSLADNKDATFIIANGDMLDMRTSTVEEAYIKGKKTDLENIQSKLYEKYKRKYHLE